MTAASARHRHIRLVVGAPGAGACGIQEAFVEEVRRLKAGDALRPVTVLVGSNYLRMHLSRLLAIRLGGHVGVRILLLRDLARELGAPPLVDKGRRRVPDLGRDLLLRQVVAARAHGSYFREIAARDGFLEALSATIRDLKEAALDPAALRAAAAVRRKGGPKEPGDDLSAGKLEDLADLFEAYDDLLRERRFYDDEDLMRSAAARAAAAEGSPGAEARGEPAADVLVYGFYDATWTQRLLIREHLSFRDGVVFFPFQRQEAGGWYDYAAPMLDWFSSWIGQRVDLPEAPEKPPAEVAFLSAPGEVRETVEATRWLLSLARDRSLPFGEMGLLYRSPDPYVKLAPEVMEQAGGVPHFLADGRPLAAARAARTLLLLLRAREEGLTRRSVMDVLSLTRQSGPASLWDCLSREAGVVKGIDDWRRKLERLAARPAAARPARELLRWVEELRGALEALPVEASWGSLTQAAIDLLRRFAPEDSQTDQVESAIAALGALDEVSTPVGLDRFTAVLKQALEREGAHPSGSDQFQRSGIFVGSVMDARLLSFHALAVVGLVERSFPVPPRQDPILLDEEREAVNRAAGAARLQLKAHRAEEERLLFRLACASATESLLLSYPRLEPASARPRIPSPFLLKLARVLEERLIDYESLERLARTKVVGLGALAPEDPRAALFSREFDLCVLKSAPGDAAARRRVASYLHANPILHRALEAEEARWGEPRFTAHDGVILRPNVLEALGSLHPLRGAPVSASRIEAYAACPLAYFMREVLGLKELEDPEQSARIDPLRRGSLVHRILFELFTALRDLGLLPLTKEKEAAALGLLDEVAARCFAREERSGMTGHAMLWEIDKEQIRDDLAAVIVAEAAEGPGEGRAGAWVPAHFEIRYGPEPGGDADREGEDPASAPEPLPFEVGPGRAALLRGKIDRIDVAGDGSEARITDYKTGRMERYEDDRLQGGTTVQLPLYMLAAERLLAPSRPGIRAGSARYLSVDRRGGFKTVSFSAEALARWREELARVVTTFTNGVARGVFFAYPDPEVCRRCDYRLACGEGREARFARKRGDATASDFLRMREGVE